MAVSSINRPILSHFALYELMTYHKTILTTSSYQLIAPAGRYRIADVAICMHASDRAAAQTAQRPRRR